MDDKTLHDPVAAALWHAIALRRLCSYRAARASAKLHGDDLSGLFEPPSFADLSDAYIRLIEEYLGETISTANVARCALDLIAAIAQDRQFTYIFQDAEVVGEERDQADQIRLIGALSNWIDRRDIADAVAGRGARS